MRSARVQINVRVGVELHRLLVDESTARKVSINWLCNRLLIEGLERLIPADELTLTKHDAP